MKYDFESILQRLRDGLHGEVSTLEGTFGGDILQAVAAELARIWSQEMDTVSQRSFVMTAEGPWLDAVCGNYGVVRKEQETDELLRQRMLDRIRRRGAGGNASDYVAWAMEVAGVEAADAVPLARGAGTVDVYFVGSPAVKPALEAELERRRPVGADVRVLSANTVRVAVGAKVRLQEGRTLASVREELTELLDGYLRRIRLAPDGSTISINRIIGVLMNCRGVEDASQVTINGKNANLPVARGSCAILDNVTLEEMAHV